jgi:CRISPR-associated protein Cas6
MNATSAATAQIHEEPYVNISFPVQGQQLPADHGYLVYSAISRVTDRGSSPTVMEGFGTEPLAVASGSLRVLHKTDWLAIELISGFPSGQGLIALPNRGATLRLRIPADHYREVLPLAGKRLDIGGHQIRLGLPVARQLEPAPSLYARVVTIKKFTEPEPFLEAVNRQLDAIDVKGRAELPLDVAQTVSLRSEANSKPETQNSKLDFRYRRRIVTIHGKSVVGFSVAVHDLNDEDSLKLQSFGIGGRRAMGCGIFNPISG